MAGQRHRGPRPVVRPRRPYRLLPRSRTARSCPRPAPRGRRTVPRRGVARPDIAQRQPVPERQPRRHRDGQPSPTPSPTAATPSPAPVATPRPTRRPTARPPRRPDGDTRADPATDRHAGGDPDREPDPGPHARPDAGPDPGSSPGAAAALRRRRVCCAPQGAVRWRSGWTARWGSAGGSVSIRPRDGRRRGDPCRRSPRHPPAAIAVVAISATRIARAEQAALAGPGHCRGPSPRRNRSSTRRPACTCSAVRRRSDDRPGPAGRRTDPAEPSNWPCRGRPGRRRRRPVPSRRPASRVA